ncbi:tapasin-related protein-like [Alligator mississippiensis]|uniref:Tapasin-related protein-like n=1 Tax=Alligator mississippiensis TaxID=8496 RepID=A0A151MKT6_ALLMI|nr:tapasin-related protein-like [Alligator mississippiensis]
MGLGAPLLLPLLHPLFLGAAGAMLTLYTAPETRAALGSVALLKCRFNVGRPIDPAVLRVRWLSAAAGPVAQYDRGQGTFEPRLRLSEQELQIGNASLEVQDVAVQDNGTYTCEVAYGTETQLGKTTLWVLAAPRISLDQRVGGAETSLLCHVGGFFPEDMEATLLRDEQVLNGSTRSSPQRNQDGTFNLTLTYTFTPVRSDAGAVFTCRVRHPVLGQPLVEEFALDVPGSDRTGAAIGAVVAIVLALGAAGAASYCWRQRRAPPELSRIQVLARWDPPDQVPFAVHLHGFYPNGIHRVEWSMDGKAWERSEPSYYAENEDGTFSARSVWRVASRCLARPEQRVRVRVQHGPADPPIAGELSIGDTGVLRPPEVSGISPRSWG